MIGETKAFVPERWTWYEVDFKTRAIIATFSGSVGIKRGFLSPEEFLVAMSEAFDYGLVDVTDSLGRSGWEGTRRAVVDSLQDSDPPAIVSTIQEIGALAGVNDGIRALAEQVSRQIIGEQRYEAIPGLQVLSELAVSRLTLETETN